MKSSYAGIVGLVLLLGAATVIGVQAWTLARAWYDILTGNGMFIAPSWFVTRVINTAFAFYLALAIHRRLRGRASIPICSAGFVVFVVTFLYMGSVVVVPSYVGAHFIAILVLIGLDIRRLASVGFIDRRIRENE